MPKYVSNVTTFKVDTAFNLNTFVSGKKKDFPKQKLTCSM